MFRSLRFHLDIYIQYAIQNFKVKLSYPFDFFVNLIGTLTYGFLNVLFLWVLLQKVPHIQGWTFHELVFMYGMGEFTFGCFAIFFFHLSVRLSEHYIVEGHLDRPLVRPISPLLQLMMENMDLFDVVILMKGGLLMGWAWMHMGLPFDGFSFLYLLIAIVSGALVYFGCFLFVASFSFFFPDRGGLMMPLFSLSDVSRYPLTIYPPGIRFFFSYLLPFAFTAYYPSLLALQKGVDTASLILQMGLVSLVSILAGVFLFHVGLSRYQSTGT